MPTPAALNPLPDRFGSGPRRRSLTDGVGQRLQVVRRGLLARGQGQPHDVPAPRRREPVSVRAAQVVAVRLHVGGERPEHSRRVPVYVGQRADGIPLAGRATAPPRLQPPTPLPPPFPPLPTRPTLRRPTPHPAGCCA